MLRILSAATLAVAAVAVAAPTLAAPSSAESAVAKARLQVRTGTLGTYLADASGRSLYLFTKDSSRKSACSGACAKTWPPYLTSGKPLAGRGVSTSKLGTIKRNNGSTQVTYNGHPLYRYAADKAKGETRGQGIGSVWYLVTPAGSKLVKQPAPPTTTTPTTTDGGYPTY